MNCEICGSKNNLVVHHIDNNPSNNTYKNLQFLCQSCYMKIHKPKPICSVAACIMPKKYEVEPVNDWISVKDKLPELYKNVLTIDSEGKIFINWLEEVTETKSYFAYGGESVTHWQPLPKPPKEGKDD